MRLTLSSWPQTQALVHSQLSVQVHKEIAHTLLEVLLVFLGALFLTETPCNPGQREQ
jgi:hypothetical protein